MMCVCVFVIRNQEFEKALFLWYKSFPDPSHFPQFLLTEFSHAFNHDTLSSSSSSSPSLDKFIKSLLEYEVDSNIRTYNTIVKGFREYPAGGRGVELCLKMLKWMLSLSSSSNHSGGSRRSKGGIRPDRVTINTMVDIAVSQNKFAIAENVSAIYLAFYYYIIMLCL